MKENDIQAFPCEYHAGMSLRDWFAGKAVEATDLEAYANKFGDLWAERVATDSYELADAMLKARERN